MRVDPLGLMRRGITPEAAIAWQMSDMRRCGWSVWRPRRGRRSMAIAPLRTVRLCGSHRRELAALAAHERAHVVQFGGRLRGWWLTLRYLTSRRVRLAMEVEAMCHEAHAVWCLSPADENMARVAARMHLAEDLAGVTKRCGRHCVGADPVKVQVEAFARLDELIAGAK